jgi:hypothetical protein
MTMLRCVAKNPKKSRRPRLLRRDSSEDPIRVWVVGCSTGEEAYSLAIALLDSLNEAEKKCRCVEWPSQPRKRTLPNFL